MITIYNKSNRNRLMIEDNDFSKYEKEGWVISKNSKTKLVNCLECGKEYNLRLSKSKFCCRSCSIKDYRKKQKENPEKERMFRDKLAKSVSSNWKENDYIDRINKMKITLKETLSKMTIEERVEKFGWLNKIIDEKLREEKIKQLLEPLKKFYKNITEEELIELNKKRFSFNPNKEIKMELHPRIYKNLNKLFNLE
jgi:hypothetical protein